MKMKELHANLRVPIRYVKNHEAREWFVLFRERFDRPNDVSLLKYLLHQSYRKIKTPNGELNAVQLTQQLE